MTGADLLPATVLKRKAVVYVRQSTQTQVQTHLESQRRQYDLVEAEPRARHDRTQPAPGRRLHHTSGRPDCAPSPRRCCADAGCADQLRAWACARLPPEL